MTVIVGIIALGLGLGASLFLPVPQNLKTKPPQISSLKSHSLHKRGYLILLY